MEIKDIGSDVESSRKEMWRGFNEGVFETWQMGFTVETLRVVGHVSFFSELSDFDSAACWLVARCSRILANTSNKLPVQF